MIGISLCLVLLVWCVNGGWRLFVCFVRLAGILFLVAVMLLDGSRF